MIRFRFAAALAAVLCMSFAALATAQTGPTASLRGTTRVIFSRPFVSALRSAEVTISALSPATGASRDGSSSPSFSLPVGGGVVRTNPFTGTVYTGGGLALRKGNSSVSLRHLIVFLNRSGSLTLTALRRVGRTRVCAPVYRQDRRLCVEQGVYRFVRIAVARMVSRRGTTATGTLRLTAHLARFIDSLTASTPIRAGDVLGTITVSAIRP
jgi:hypothetical protein